MQELLADAHVWVALSTIVFIALVWKPVGRLIIGALDARTEKIKHDFAEAQSLLNEAENLLTQYQDKQTEAKEQAEALLKHAHAEAEQIRRRAAAEIEVALKAREKHAMDRIRQAENAALAEIRNAAIQLAMATARQVVNDNLDDKAAEQLMTGTLAQIGRKPS